MSRFTIGSIVAVVLALASAGAWYWLRDDEQNTYRVSRGSIDVTIQTIGRVQSTGSTIVRTQIAGEIETIAVQPGDRVVEGDVLIALVAQPLERAVGAAERQLEDAEFALQLAQRALEQAPDDETRRLAVIQAAQRVSNAEVALEDAEIALRNRYILAPRPGTIVEVPVRSGDLINRAAPVATLFDLGDLEVIANVDELDLANITIGADAVLRLDAFPDREIPGRVLATAPAAREQGGATIFATTIELDLPEGIDIRPGMNADVTIVTEAREGVLLVPQRAIRSVGNRAFVQVIVDGEQVEREVILGYRSSGQAEVVSGLSEGDVIVLP